MPTAACRLSRPPPHRSRAAFLAVALPLAACAHRAPSAPPPAPPSAEAEAAAPHARCDCHKPCPAHVEDQPCHCHHAPAAGSPAAP